MRAVIWDGSDLAVVDDVDVRPPGPGEVRVRVQASGICHSDLNVIDRAAPGAVPVILGHEAAGTVEETGPGTDGVAVGDAVAVGSMTPCGRCRACGRGRFSACPETYGRGAAPFTWRGRPVRAYANISSFAELITVRASQLVAATGLEPAAAALVGCAVSTGFGVVRNVARVEAGDAVVVIGVGGIGVNALQTARLQGATTIVAADTNPAKEAVARRFGAGEFVLVDPGALPAATTAALQAAAGRPVDAVIECSGAIGAIEAAVALPGVGGAAALVGMPAAGARASFDVDALIRGRRVLGSLNGAIDPHRDLPDIVSLAVDGRLDLAGQVTRIWPVAEVADAIRAVRAGTVIRAVLDHTA